MGRTGAVLALLASVVISSIADAAEPSPPTRASSWELKGLKLGMSASEAKALIPIADCQSPAPGIETCFDSSQTFAEGKVKLYARFLDGALIYVAAKHISLTQADAAAAGLTAKYGPADRTWASRKYVRDQDKMITKKHYVWIEGDVALIVTPFDEDDPSTERRFSAVSLLNKKLYDTAWLPRRNGSSTAAASDL